MGAAVLLPSEPTNREILMLLLLENKNVSVFNLDYGADDVLLLLCFCCIVAATGKKYFEKKIYVEFPYDFPFKIYFGLRNNSKKKSQVSHTYLHNKL